MAKYILMKWKTEYEIGIQIIDEQHRKMIDLINDLYSAFFEKVSKEEYEPIIDAMNDYAAFHFRTEENLFLRYDYLNKEEHIKGHKNFTQKSAQYRNDFETGKLLNYDMINFLKKWWDEHILGEDMKYSAFLRSQIKK